ncbi:MAG: glyoxalase, partial [Thermoplasmata archaeon]
MYADALGISFEEAPGGYLHTGKLPGAKHLALWPLSQAAESCFGVRNWPRGSPVPQAWIEFDVEDVGTASQELRRLG